MDASGDVLQQTAPGLAGGLSMTRRGKAARISERQDHRAAEQEAGEAMGKAAE